jgi:hypothetical protein
MKKFNQCAASFMAVLATTFIFSSIVVAGGIPLNVIGPHEYALPVNFEPFNAVAQYSYFQSDRETFDSGGNKVDGPDTFTAVGFTKYVHFFTLKSLQDVGIAWEVLLPEISVQKSGFSVSGFGDPLTGFAVWIKPNKNSTVGVQSFLSIPAGSDSVSDNTWGSLTTIIGDWQMGDINIDGQLGYIHKTTRHQTGANDVDPGDTFHANLRLAYRANQYFEPFVAADYQTTGGSSDKGAGRDIPNSTNNEISCGGGLLVNISDPLSLAMRYDVGVDGKNTTVTNAFHIKLAYVW